MFDLSNSPKNIAFQFVGSCWYRRTFRCLVFLGLGEVSLNFDLKVLASLFGVAQQHVRVLIEKHRILYIGVARCQRPLHHHNLCIVCVRERECVCVLVCVCVCECE